MNREAIVRIEMTDEELEEIFTYQNPSNIDPKRFQEIRNEAKNLAYAINKNGGWTKDKEMAIKKLRECIFYAIASIIFEHKEKSNIKEIR